MATDLGNLLSSKVITALDTYTHTAEATDYYKVDVRLFEMPTSSISIQIKQNSTVIATSTAPTARQRHIELQALISCTTNDVISVVLSSSNAQESATINQIKAIIDIRRGLV
jgi:hypothetical protein